MPSLLNERLEAVEQQALSRLVEVALPLVEAMLGPNGRAYGDVSLDRGDRIARFEDMARRGVLDILQTISRPTYDSLLRQYIEDVAESPLVRMP